MVPKKDDEEENEKSPVVLERYRKRLSIMRLANEYASRDNPVKAVEGYLNYLNILAVYYEVEEAKLTPNLFNREKEMAELLLISQVYWNLAKIYDRNPRLQEESRRCLNQFIRFSVGFKYQYINAQMLRKFLRKKVAYNTKNFEDAYRMIKVDSKKCYIATYVLGEEHWATFSLRTWRENLMHSPRGASFVSTYYSCSPHLVEFFASRPIVGAIAKQIFRPLLIIWAALVSRIYR